jgi:hypothetical protein
MRSLVLSFAFRKWLAIHSKENSYTVKACS